MQNITLPKKVRYEKSDEPHRGQIIIEPCYPGYGITIGNSLRRVLLSSLPGAAVIGVKIEGVSHEFTTLDNLKEDILEFVMNLKKLRIKVFSEEIEKLELKIHGTKEIKASDIKKSNVVEIVNPDLNLGKITDMSGSINVEIFVKSGIGYETVDSRREKSNEIGYIEIDSIYSPVLSTGIKIENVRVGKETDWEKLTIDLKTDGTIDPQFAFEDSVKILIDQFTRLSGVDKEKEGEEPASDYDVAREEEDEETEEAEEEKPRKKRGRPKKTE